MTSAVTPAEFVVAACQRKALAADALRVARARLAVDEAEFSRDLHALALRVGITETRTTTTEEN